MSKSNSASQGITDERADVLGGAGWTGRVFRPPGPPQLTPWERIKSRAWIITITSRTRVDATAEILFPIAELCLLAVASATWVIGEPVDPWSFFFAVAAVSFIARRNGVPK